MFEKIRPEVLRQLKSRENIFSKKNRNQDDLYFLNSKTGWVRLISSINTDALYRFETTGDLNLSSSNPNLAKKFILSSPVDLNTDLKKRDGILVSGNTGLYNFTDAMGYRPSPGITDFKIVSKNRWGTIREATINFNVWSISDINFIEKLYFHPGFTGIVEWGHTIYVDEKGTVQTSPAFDTSLPDFFEKKTFGQIEEVIAENREKHNFNYDGFIGYFKNFSWSFRADGGYDCSVSLISLGEVLESLSTKLPPIRISSKTESKPQNYKTFIHQFIDEVKMAEGEDLGNKTTRVKIKHLPNELKEPIKTVTGYNDDITIAKVLQVITGVNGITGHDTTRLAYVSLRNLLNIVNLRYGLNYNNNTCFESEKSVYFATGKEGVAQFNTFPEHFSLDPTVCILPQNPQFENLELPVSVKFGEDNEVYSIDPELLEKQIGLVDVKRDLLDLVNIPKNQTRIDIAVKNCLSIYICLETVLESLEKFTTPAGSNFELPILDFVKDILIKVNEALGNITELDVATYDETGRIYSVVDRKFQPIISKEEVDFQFNLTGLKSQFSNLSIQSKISNKLGSMISIAAQGTDPSSTIKQGNYNEDTSLWRVYNRGLVDRHIQDLEVGTSSECIPIGDVIIEQPKKWYERIWKGFKDIAATRPGTMGYGIDSKDLEYLKQTTSSASQTSTPTPPPPSISAEQQEFEKFIVLAGVSYSKLLTSPFFKLEKERFQDLKTFGQKFFKIWNNSFIAEDGRVPAGVIPVELSFTLDGVGGLKIGNIFTINSEVIPEKYNEYGYIVVGLDHSISNSKWVTNVRAQTFLLSKKSSSTPQEQQQQKQGTENQNNNKNIYNSNDCSSDGRVRLSTNFNLAQVSCRAFVTKFSVPSEGQSKAWKGKFFTRDQIIENLTEGVVNVLEPIKLRYPSIIITSGYRNSSNTSQHEVGQAFDIQFNDILGTTVPNQNASMLVRANEIKALLQARKGFDQFLLEYKTTGTKQPWLHISYVKTGNRNQIKTFLNDKPFQDNGFVNAVVLNNLGKRT